MNSVKEIDAFVHQCFDMYGLSFKLFFGEMVNEEEDENGVVYGGDLEELPLVIGKNINMELLEKAAITLGVSTESLLQMDREAVCCWYNKYPYFSLRREFEITREHSLRYTASSEEMLLAAIFSENFHRDNYKRYKGNVRERLIEQLISYNSVMPGCYHEGCEIKKLMIRTNNFTHFEKIDKLVESYLSMADRARTLFYKLWNEELPDNEIREYNFLVSVLGMRDVGYSAFTPIYYELARKFAPVYKQEGYTDYASYITYRGADFPAVYTCKEFLDSPELVEKMVQEFPRLKADIGKMAFLSKNFLCTFIWSDEPEPINDVITDEILVEALRFWDEDVPPKYHHVGVPKNKDELNGDEPYIALCESLSAPSSQGGLKLFIPECEANANEISGIKRLLARLSGTAGRGSQNR